MKHSLREWEAKYYRPRVGIVNGEMVAVSEPVEASVVTDGGLVSFLEPEDG